MTKKALLWKLFSALCAAVFVHLFPSFAFAQTPSACEEFVAAWANGCPELRTACLRAVLCPPGSVILETGCQADERVRIEASRASDRAFRNVGEVGISPIGNFPDWSSVAESKRKRFDQVQACLAKDPSLIVPKASSPPLVPTASGPSETPVSSLPGANFAVPWRLLVGLFLGGMLVRTRWREGIAKRTIVTLAFLFVGSLSVRALVFPATFFHPNGQGPFWIGFALDDNGRHSSYGPGFWELYSTLVQFPWFAPESLIFVAQAFLGAASVVCGWVIVREASGSRMFAAGTALTLAMSPLLGRISQSQSYYATWTSLLFLAATVLVVGVPSKEGNSRRFVLAVVAAGLLVSQAARVTPIGWMAATILPFSVFAKKGFLGASQRGKANVTRASHWGAADVARTQIRLALLAGLGIFVVVAITSGQTLLGVVRGSLGTQWLPLVRIAGPSAIRQWIPALPFLFVLALASADRICGFAKAFALIAAVCLMEVTCLVRSDPDSFQRAYMAMGLPVLLTLVVSLVAHLQTRSLRMIGAASLAVFALVYSARTWETDTELPTNVMEAQLMQKWREKLPPGSTVVYVGRVEPHVLVLPLYGVHSRVPIDPWVLNPDETLPNLERLTHGVYYYESSHCAAPRAKQFCGEIRSRWELSDPIETAVLPARSSSRISFFAEESVAVALYRLR